MPYIKTATLGVWVGAGSRNEREAEHGLSHLIEHMAFKGTRRRSARRIAEDIENVGGEINAATSVEFTNYTARVLGETIGVALDVLGDILTEFELRGKRARAREGRHPAGIRGRRGRPRRSRLRRLHGDGLRRPGDRASDPRPARDHQILRRRDHPGLHGARIRPRAHGARRRRRRAPRRRPRRRRAPLRRPARGAPGRRRAGVLHRRRAAHAAPARAGEPRPRTARLLLQGPASITRPTCSPMCWAAG